MATLTPSKQTPTLYGSIGDEIFSLSLSSSSSIHKYSDKIEEEEHFSADGESINDEDVNTKSPLSQSESPYICEKLTIDGNKKENNNFNFQNLPLQKLVAVAMGDDPPKKKGVKKQVKEKVRLLLDEDYKKAEQMRKHVIKRDGTRKVYDQNKIIDTLIDAVVLRPSLDYTLFDVYSIASSIEPAIVDGMHTSEISTILAEAVQFRSKDHPDFDKLAVRLAVANLHKMTHQFSDLKTYFKTLRNGVIPKECIPVKYQQDDSFRPIPLRQSISNAGYEFGIKFCEILQKVIQFERDYNYEWFGFQTMLKQYTLKFPYRINSGTAINYASLERPQHSLLRFALEVSVPDPERYFQHIVHLSNAPARVWDENYNTLNTRLWSDDGVDRFHQTMEENNPNQQTPQPQPQPQQQTYNQFTPKPIISNFLNPFKVPASHLIERYKFFSSNTSDKEIFDLFCHEYLDPRSEEEDYDLLINVIYLYHLLSLKIISPPTTVFQAGKKFVSCFLVGKPGDSIPLIYGGITEGALLGRDGGGFSTLLTNVRAINSYIGGSNAISMGIMPIIRIMDQSIRYVKQAGNAGRNGPNTSYLESYHFELFEFLDSLRIEAGQDYRMFELKGAVALNELLIQRACRNEQWSLFCPKDVPKLATTWGKEFEEAYKAYESDSLIRRKTFKAQDVLIRIIETLHDVGHGACNIVHIDNMNRLSMMRCPANGMKIQSANICLEINQPSSPYETPTCVIFTLVMNAFWLRPSQISILEELFNNFHWLNVGLQKRTPWTLKPKDLKEQYPKRARSIMWEADKRKWILSLNEKWIQFGKTTVKGLNYQIQPTTSSSSPSSSSSTSTPKTKEKKTIAWDIVRQVSGFVNFITCSMINQTVYPSYCSLVGGLHQRAVGLGMQGAQTLFVSLDIPYDSPMAANVIYKFKEAALYGSYENSLDMAALYGVAPYWAQTNGLKNSLDAKGILPFHLYEEVNPELAKKTPLEEVSVESAEDIIKRDPNFFERKTLFNSETLWNAPELNWDHISKRLIQLGGKYNSLLTCQQPTATSSIVTSSSPSIEPFMYLMGKQKTITGEYVTITTRLIRKLIKMGQWNPENKEAICSGNFQNMNLPKHLKQLFKTAWLMDPRSIIQLFFHGQVMTDQSSSMNLWQTEIKLRENFEVDAETKHILRKKKLKTILDMILYGATVCGVGGKTLCYYLFKNFVAPTNLSELNAIMM
jgi:ribonucleotide reductase alpha subunit/transcriptional regulator NrdR family protein